MWHVIHIIRWFAESRSNFSFGRNRRRESHSCPADSKKCPATLTGSKIQFVWNPDRGLYTSWAILYLDAWKRAVPQFHSVFIKNLNRRPVLFSVIWYNFIEAMAILNIFWCICHSFFHNQKLNWLKTNLEASFFYHVSIFKDKTIRTCTTKTE